jgi:5-methylcytosine-specific restriction endonuclease McrA
MAKTGGSFTQQEWEALKAYYDCTCLRCGRQEPDIELTVDHVVPLSQGG